MWFWRRSALLLFKFVLQELLYFFFTGKITTSILFSKSKKSKKKKKKCVNRDTQNKLYLNITYNSCSSLSTNVNIITALYMDVNLNYIYCVRKRWGKGIVR